MCNIMKIHTYYILVKGITLLVFIFVEIESEYFQVPDVQVLATYSSLYIRIFYIPTYI